MVKALVIGATGYAGVELVRLLSRHRRVQLVGVTSQSHVDKPLSFVYPHLSGHVSLICKEQEMLDKISEADVVFVALPHGYSAPVVRKALDSGIKVIDLGADFRFDEADSYEEWYGEQHKEPELLAISVYGLPEVNRSKIKEAQLIANPGCYPTSTLLGLAPLVRERMVDLNSIVIDSKSGISGAGRKLTLATHFAESNENVSAYNVARHRHTPEIEQELAKLAGEKVKVTFTPHLIPMTRGILSTIYASLTEATNSDKLREIYLDYYRHEPFIRILPEEQWPHTKWVYGSNYCDLNLRVDHRTNRVIVVSAIDNLVKGAAGQAVQNMNLMFGFPETEGLEVVPVFP
ncbi:N-acetyl-gamma-glutamyl-phosphate reductase [Calderihabitans maritimus]|uniref:N-acetyl-gamma-glutamyl-phosphate reductase n=1 Tax=Calderihabitans maritimus TaxID=1246530 RepID=A0A1Z5HMV7_9FIRM|nr:N-acetyl-gamma-glutamyl-phosphate reductase [Calderihabitans maritimus]GAW90853.1 N-acetyl-gamma-glutamyl-phosphate reductase [Calderihabitans maritimus]